MTDTTNPPPGNPPSSGFLGLPLFGGAGNSNQGGGLGILSSLFGGGDGSGKSNKGAAAGMGNLPSTKDVPTATTGFYQQADPATRAALLSTMMQRAKQGTNPQPIADPAGTGLQPLPPPAAASASAPPPSGKGSSSLLGALGM